MLHMMVAFNLSFMDEDVHLQCDAEDCPPHFVVCMEVRGFLTRVAREVISVLLLPFGATTACSCQVLDSSQASEFPEQASSFILIRNESLFFCHSRKWCFSTYPPMKSSLCTLRTNS